jgi:hypothetical protein
MQRTVANDAALDCPTCLVAYVVMASNCETFRESFLSSLTPVISQNQPVGLTGKTQPCKITIHVTRDPRRNDSDLVAHETKDYVEITVSGDGCRPRPLRIRPPEYKKASHI